MNKLISLSLISIASLLVGCDEDFNAGNNQPTRRDTTFQYIPLNEYQYTAGNIEPGTTLQLIEFSGGEQNPDGTVYYYQFIAVNKSSGDTLRILAPLITLISTEKDMPNTYTSPVLYNPAKGITTAVYSKMDSTQNWALQPTDKLIDTSMAVQNSKNVLHAKELVVVNKTKPIFMNTNYKTVIGVLNFNGIPW